ncbi:hypothetical protein NDU88_001680 [Pleurodeles waltl]|uniref:Uncharacterized protein n=1 Tax=Pleurodeles waltl TaxID=8319 RepID=A0AAV7TJG8_PLEWA|nr:hypothetical protein NDU88_001680 [Pleurodeles waltl]
MPHRGPANKRMCAAGGASVKRAPPPVPQEKIAHDPDRGTILSPGDVFRLALPPAPPAEHLNKKLCRDSAPRVGKQAHVHDGWRIDKEGAAASECLEPPTGETIFSPGEVFLE